MLRLAFFFETLTPTPRYQQVISRPDLYSSIQQTPPWRGGLGWHMPRPRSKSAARRHGRPANGRHGELVGQCRLGAKHEKSWRIVQRASVELRPPAPHLRAFSILQYMGTLTCNSSLAYGRMWFEVRTAKFDTCVLTQALAGEVTVPRASRTYTYSAHRQDTRNLSPQQRMDRSSIT